MTAATNLDERHAMRLIELAAAKAIIRDLQDELALLRDAHADALTTIDVLQNMLTATTALTVAVAELAAVRGVAK